MTELDAIESAEEGGLRYVSDTMPGVRRRRVGTGFSYIRPDGVRITDQKRLAWFRRLAIPPAWTDVWICPIQLGHLQATGRDARGRKVYRYHPRWRAVRDEVKYEHTLAFGRALPQIRCRVDDDLARRGLPREKLLAAVVRLLEKTRIRVGNPEYARENRSFGLTTLRDRHADVGTSQIRFKFKGKSGKVHQISVSDRRLARIVARSPRGHSRSSRRSPPRHRPRGTWSTPSRRSPSCWATRRPSRASPTSILR